MMDIVQKEVLDLQHNRLVTSLRANDVIDRLLKENAINKYDYDQLKRTEAQGARAMNRLLLLTLRRRGGAQAFPAFQRSLLDSGQKDLHDDLKRCELDLLDGVLTDRLQQIVNGGGRGDGAGRGGGGRGGGRGDGAGRGGGGRGGGGGGGFSSELPLNGELHGLHDYPALDLGRDLPYSPAVTSRSESPVPVLQKASSPALKNPPTPRKPLRPQISKPPSRAKESDSTPPTSPKDFEERDHQLKQLEEQVQELRKSYSKMEAEMKQHIERLEKEKKEADGKKKDGGCAVM